MIPTVPALQQMLLELDERSWFSQAHLMSPGYLRGGGNWMMEPLVEVYAIHKPYLPNSGLTVYRGISGEQFHGSSAS